MLGGKRTQAFNAWLDAKMSSSPVAGLLVYPEGTRSTRPTSLPLKRGMLHFAYGRGLPVQVIISRGKEEVLSEKFLAAHWGSTLVVGYSELVRPSDSTDFEGFVKAVQEVWDRQWASVYGVEASGEFLHCVSVAMLLVLLVIALHPLHLRLAFKKSISRS